MLHNFAAQIVHLSRSRIHLGANHGTCFIYKVNRLIRQETVGDIAVGKRRSRNQCAVVNFYAMEHFIAFFQAAQNRNCIFDGRLFYHDGLETALQRGVFFDILAILVQRCRADAVQLTARQKRF